MRRNTNTGALAHVAVLVAVSLGLSSGTSVLRADDKGVGAEGKLAAKHLGLDRHALVIGIDDYGDPRIPDLTVCEDDARAVHGLLTNADVGGVAASNAALLLGADATFARVRSVLSAYRRLPRSATLFVYFSGHGAREGQDTFWVTQDAQLGDLFGTSISEMFLQDALRRTPAERVIVMNDCCHAAGLASGEKALGDMAPILERYRGKGRAILSAAGALEEAREDRTSGRSVFTLVLVEGLAGKADANEDGIVTLSELATYLDRGVSDRAREVGGLQRPHVDYQGVQEPSKFWLTVDPTRLREKEREDRSKRVQLERRMKELEKLYFAGTIPMRAYRLGKELLEVDREDLEPRQREQRALLARIADGDFATKTEIERALALVLEDSPSDPGVPSAPSPDCQSIDMDVTCTVSPQTILAGETCLAVTQVTNTGTIPLSDVTLALRGRSGLRQVGADALDITVPILGVGESQTLRCQFTADTVGEFLIDASAREGRGWAAAGGLVRLLVVAARSGDAPTPRPPGLHLDMALACRVAQHEVAVGHVIRASAEVTNTGDIPLSEVTLALRGRQGLRQVGTEDLVVTIPTLGVGDSREIHATFTSDEAGERRIDASAREGRGWAAAGGFCGVLVVP